MQRLRLLFTRQGRGDTRQLAGGEAETLSFEVPSETGDEEVRQPNRTVMRAASAMLVVLAVGTAASALQLAHEKQISQPSQASPLSSVSLGKDFCASPWKGAPLTPATPQSLAGRHVCQFVCPCCEAAVEPPEPECVAADDDDDDDDDNDRREWRERSERRLRSERSRLQLKWELEGSQPRFSQLFVVSDSSFHKHILEQVSAKHTLTEFLESKFPEYKAGLLKKQRQKSWSDGELAMYIYTGNMLYQELNQLLREATALEDIDPYWQSYVYHLKDGLERHAKYGEVETWRGVNGLEAHKMFHNGQSGVLPSFTSSSSDKAVAFSFGSVVFHFTGGGYDIQSYSAYPGEAELLLEPGREYRVGSVESMVCDGHGVSIVHMLTQGPKSMEKPEDRWQTAPKLKCPKHKLPICPVCSCCQERNTTRR